MHTLYLKCMNNISYFMLDHVQWMYELYELSEVYSTQKLPW